MNRFRIFLVVLAAVAPLILIPVSRVAAVGPKVSELGNKHNLSAKAWGPSGLTANINPYRAKDISEGGVPAGQQICIFCHTPHNASSESPSPLWNRKFSEVTNFQRYSSATLQIRVNSDTRLSAQYGPGTQPDGSSRLCLSCHDGVSKLGDLLSGTIPMNSFAGGPYSSGGDTITGRYSFNPSTNKMKVGHHPVSFKYNTEVASAIRGSGLPSKTDYLYPPSVNEVKQALERDRNNKMQCTTCHNAHQNQSDDTKCYDSTGTAVIDCGFQNMTSRKVVPFWIYGGAGSAINDHDDVCKACHPTLMTPRPFQPGAP